MSSPVFVVGLPRSGTTLLSAMLNASGQLFIGEETHFFEILKSWKNKGKLMSFSEYYFSHKRFLKFTNYSIEEISYFNNICNIQNEPKFLLEFLVSKLSSDKNLSRWGEKTPINFEFISQIRSYFPDAKIINVIRDPRDVYNSVLYTGWNMSLFYFLNRYSLNNKVSNNEFDFLLTVKYENLLDSTDSTLKKICSFLELNFTTEMVSSFNLTKFSNYNVSKEPWKVNNSDSLISNNSYKWKFVKDIKIRRLNSFIAWVLKDEIIDFKYEYFNENFILLNYYFYFKYRILWIYNYFVSRFIKKIYK